MMAILKNKKDLPLLIAGAFASFFLLIFASCFSLFENQSALVIRFGEVVRVYNKSGLKFKIPFIENVQFLDRRIVSNLVSSKEMISLDQKRIVVDCYLRYRINDPKSFYSSLRTIQMARGKLDSIAESSLRQVVASVHFASLLNSERVTLLEKAQELIVKAVSTYGIEVIDFKIIKAELPLKNSQMVFERMKSERTKDSNLLRSEGFEGASSVRAEADLLVEKIKSDAKRESYQIVAAARAEALKSYINNCSSNIELWQLLKTISAKKEAMSAQSTKIVMQSNDSLVPAK